MSSAAPLRLTACSLTSIPVVRACLYDGVGDYQGVVCLGFGLTQRRVLAVMSEGKLGYSARGAHEYETRTFES